MEINKVKHVYHGSLDKFNEIDLSKASKYGDFGGGFYLSDTQEHAISAAVRKVPKLIRKQISLKIYLYEYALPVNWKEGIVKKVFHEPDGEWFQYVAYNRNTDRSKTIIDYNYDVVYGPTADAAAARVIDDYNVGNYGETGSDAAIAKAIEALKPWIFPRQVCIKTEKAKQYALKISEKEVKDV